MTHKTTFKSIEPLLCFASTVSITLYADTTQQALETLAEIFSGFPESGVNSHVKHHVSGRVWFTRRFSGIYNDEHREVNVTVYVNKG